MTLLLNPQAKEPNLHSEGFGSYPFGTHEQMTDVMVWQCGVSFKVTLSKMTSLTASGVRFKGTRGLVIKRINWYSNMDTYKMGIWFTLTLYTVKNLSDDLCPNCTLFIKLFQTLTMAANQSATIEDVSSQPIMKIQSTNYQVERDVSLYPKELQMLIVALKHSVLSTLCPVRMEYRFLSFP